MLGFKGLKIKDTCALLPYTGGHEGCCAQSGPGQPGIPQEAGNAIYF